MKEFLNNTLSQDNTSVFGHPARRQFFSTAFKNWETQNSLNKTEQSSIHLVEA